MNGWIEKIKGLPQGVTALASELSADFANHMRQRGYFLTAYRLNVDHNQAVDLLAEWCDWWRIGLLDSDPIDKAEEMLPRAAAGLDARPGWEWGRAQLESAPRPGVDWPGPD